MSNSSESNVQIVSPDKDHLISSRSALHKTMLRYRECLRRRLCLIHPAHHMGRLDCRRPRQKCGSLIRIAKPHIAERHQIIAVRAVAHRIILVKDQKLRQGNCKVLDLYLIVQMPLAVIDQAVESRPRRVSPAASGSGPQNGISSCTSMPFSSHQS